MMDDDGRGHILMERAMMMMARDRGCVCVCVW